MNTPTNLTLSKSPNKAKSFQANSKRIISRLMAGLVLVLALALVLFYHSHGNETQAEENLPVVSYNNTLEMQYAQPWLEGQNKSVDPYSNALEMQYAQPWLDTQAEADIPYSNALEMQYAQPWLDAQKSLDCPSRLDLFYLCQNGLHWHGK